MARPAPSPGSPAPAAPTASPSLQRYREKRDFTLTPEPADTAPRPSSSHAPGTEAALSFVVQKHHATRLHYDFRLELDGVLVSWAVPRGPSLDPADKRMAVRTEDHPLAYASFEGTIPAKQYGAGQVIVWDRGRWTPDADPRAGLAAGKLGFTLYGEKLNGRWELLRLPSNAKDGRVERQEVWLLFKRRDVHARTHDEIDIVTAMPDSVLGAPGPAPAAATDTPAATPDTPAARAHPARRSAATAAEAGARPSDAGSPTESGGGADASVPDGAVRARLPDTLPPQLAQLADAVPAPGRWLFETKYDGYRLLVRVDNGRAQLVTRGGHDWTDRMPALTAAIEALGVGTAWLDGEIVVAGEHGAGDFNALQNAFDRAPRADGDTAPSITYFVFDVPYLAGHDLRAVPLQARRQRLQRLLETGAPVDGPVRLSPVLGEGGPEVAQRLLQQACAARQEGLIAKRIDAPYHGRRSTDWLKLKCRLRQEFVVCGCTERSDDALAVGSLILGVHDAAGRLQHVGSVGTGWNVATARDLRQRLRKLATDKPPFEGAESDRPHRGRRVAGVEQWVRPQLVVEVAFGEWTPAGHIRHASFVGVRTDKPPHAITRDVPVSAARAGVSVAPPPPASKPRSRKVASRTPSAPPDDAPEPPGMKASRPKATAGSAATSVAGIAVTHGDRVIDAASGATKLDLVRYYDSMADFILPHLRGRPVAMVRGPEGVGAPLFFQKHGGRIGIPGLTELDAALWPGHEALLEIRTRKALLGAAQMNVIEFHTWNSTSRNLMRPNRMVFDLDPGEGVAWPAVREGALLTRALLQELGLRSWVKTSGGKGLHVVVPLLPRWDFGSVKAFSKAVVAHLAETVPARFVVKSGPANRVGRIFVDYLRNGEGATTVAAFSARARPGLGVSMPVDWDELSRLESAAHRTVANAHQHLARRNGDPWADMDGARQSLVTPMKRLAFKA